jgi:class 3 adenylate cyclase
MTPGKLPGVLMNRSLLELVPANDDLPAAKDLNAERCLRIAEGPLADSRAAGSLDHHGETRIDSPTPGRDQRSGDVPARAVSCAHALKEAVSPIGVNFRAGIHTGDCDAGDGAPVGIAVEIADRVADRALPGEVLVSSTVRDLMAGSGVVFTSRGRLAAGDAQAEWQLHSVAMKPARRAAVGAAGA